MKSTTYRSDIDGLRAIAVISVVLYHAGLAALPGGFVGVDVFFVISGYLIAGIIFNDLARGRFSLAGFYARRIRRIQPALLAMVLFCILVFGYIFTPVDYKLFAQSVGATVTFSSNVYFFLKSGYFDPLSDTKPLLHTWSLAVEEQYYLFFPLLLAMLWRHCRQKINLVLVLSTVLSFALSLWQARMAPNAAFYLPFDRIWELLIGAIVARGMVAPLHSQAARDALAWSGLAAIVAGVVLLSSSNLFPGETALLPCLGAILIIYAGQGSQLSRYLLGTRPFVFFGKISYSIYLWHWPIFVAVRYLLFRELSAGETLAYLLATVLFAWASWKWIEQPFRHQSSDASGRRGVFASTAAVTVLGVGLALVVHFGNGFPWRFAVPARTFAAAALDTNPERERCDRRPASRILAGDICQIGARGAMAPSFVLIGDSFGDAISPGIDQAARNLGEKGLVITNSGCFPLQGIEQKDHPECAAFNQAALAYVRSQPEIKKVIFVGRWTSALLGTRYGQFAAQGWFIGDAQTRAYSYEENRKVFERAFVRTVNAFDGRKVDVIAFIPEQRYDVPRALALTARFGSPGSVEISAGEHARRQGELRALLTRLHNGNAFGLADVGARLCDSVKCAVQMQGRSLYADDNHLARQGSLWLEPLWRDVLMRN